MSVFDTKILQEKQHEAMTTLNELAQRVQNEQRSFTAEELETTDKLKTAVMDYKSQLETAKRLRSIADLQSSGETVVEIKGQRNRNRAPDFLITNEDRENALRGYMIRQAATKCTDPNKRARCEKALRPEFTEAAEKVGINLDEKQDYVFRLRHIPFWKQKIYNELRTFNGQGEGGASAWDQNGSTYASGGALTEQSQLIRFLSVSTKWHSGMYQLSNVINTEDGVYNWAPTLDDTSNAASVHTELNQMDGLDAVFSHTAVPVLVYDSATMVSIELLQDAKLPIEEVMQSEVISIRLARKENTDFTTANSTLIGLKQAVINSGTVYTSASTGTFVYNDITTALGKLDWSYLKDPSFAIQMSQTMYWNILGLTDSNNRPLMNMSMDAIEPRERLLTYPVVINNDLDSFAAGNYSMVLGAFRHSLIRVVQGATNIRVLNERFIYDNLAVGIVGWRRSGYACVIPKAFVICRTHS